MSSRNPVHHHVAMRHRRAQRRSIIDIVLVLIFLCAIVLIVFAHFMRTRQEAVLVDAIAHERQIQIEAAREESAKQRVLNEELQRLRTAEEAGRGEVASTSAPLLSEDTLTTVFPADDTSTVFSTSSLASVSGTKESVLGFVRFEDVKATRYENLRSGFVMEIPTGWSEVYSYGEDMAIANTAYPTGTSVVDIAKKKDAMWMRAVRPCVSTEATSTIFAFASSTDMSIREASACVPPFLVTLGYRTDTSATVDFIGKERFLLSMGRTLYPIVSSIPPYLPIR